MLHITKVDDTTFKIAVDGRRQTTHRVTVNPAYYQKLTGGNVTPEVLIEKSFEFLLERESNTDILSAFDLPLIGKYFPEYEETLRKMCLK